MRISPMIGSGLSLVFGTILVLGGCATTVSETEDASGEESEANIASTQEAIYSGWTPYTSEEYPPIVCDGGSLINTVQCSGSYCDNIRTYCQPTGASKGSSYWTSYFSEEGTNWRYCSSGYWVTGIACSGSYCDNISIQCSYIANVTAINCYWTGWMSEENGGTLNFGAGYYMRGAQCNGRYCDNKRYYVCQKG